MIKPKIIQLNSLVDEFIEVNSFYKRYMAKWKALSKRYESGQLSYKEFKFLESKLFLGKSVKEFKQEQTLYAYSLIKRILILLDALITDVYKDKVEVQVHPLKNKIEQVVKEAEKYEQRNKPPQKVEVQRVKVAKEEVKSPQKNKNVQETGIPSAEAPKHQIEEKQSVKIGKVTASKLKSVEPVLSVSSSVAGKQKKLPNKSKSFIEQFVSILRHKQPKNYVLLEKAPEVSYKLTGEPTFKAETNKRVNTSLSGRSENEKFKVKNPKSQRALPVKFQKHEIVNKISTGVELGEKPKYAEKKKAVPVSLRTKKLYQFEESKPVRVKAESKVEEQKQKEFPKKASTKHEKLSSNTLNYINLLKKIRSKNSLSNELKQKPSKNLVSDKNFVPVAVELLDAKNKKKEILTPKLKAEVEEISKVSVPKRVYKSYTTTTIASVSNMMVRGLSSKLLELYPDFFRSFYKKLRSAEIPLLSNTYINIMLFFMILTALVSFSTSLVVFLVTSTKFLVALAKSLLISLLSSAGVFAMFYLYPTSLIAEKNKDIRRNLPFAINQMAAIASADLPPLTIFKIVASNNEYGEVSKELAKIVNYVEIFGIDFLVAVKSVASTTPNEFFKDFLQGLVLTVNSGEKLDTYLKQKAKEALGIYEREIEKYNATVSTLSDIYTAILIAAPLLMISSLSLIQMIGGKIAGFGVGFLMAVTTYVVLPVLNLLFIMIVRMIRTSV